jgi:hypothetical protein
MMKKQGAKAMVFSGGFRREYDRTFQKNPFAANFHLLLCEKGREIFARPFPDLEMSRLIVRRFKDPRAYHLPKEAKR